MKKVIILFVFLFIVGCYIDQDVIADYTQCYDAENNNIDRFCKINGYYISEKNDNCSIIFNLILYKDGSVVFNAIRDNILYKGDSLYKINSFPSWGTFKVVNNEIIAQKIDFSFIGKSTVTEYKMKIVNDTTLWLIYSKVLTKKYFEYNDSTSNDYIPFLFFKPLNNKPESTYYWLKKEKWFWCDKQKYKEYKKWLREQKRKK